MKFIFWHHDVHGPLDLEDLWRGTHGFAGSVARMRLLFWIAARGHHQVYLVGNVRSGVVRGVTAVPGEPWSDARFAPDAEHRAAILVMQTAPTEEAWRRLKSHARDFTTILWLAGPLPHVRWIERANRGELSSIVCISQYQRNLYRIYRGFQRLEVCYLGIDLDLMDEVEEKRASVPVALFCSIPRRTKGLHHVLRAWPSVRSAVPNAQLWISGSAKIHDPAVEVGSTGILDPSLEREFPQFFGAPPMWHGWGIEFLGAPADLRDVYRAMKQAWVGVVNCNWMGSLEMFCRSAIEAQTAGLPVVGAAAGSLPEVVRHGITGILVRKRSSQSLADALIQLLAHSPTRSKMSNAAKGWSRGFAEYEPLVDRWEAMAARAESRQPAPFSRPNWSKDLLRAVGYGSARAWARERIRGTAIEQQLLNLIASR
jgi:glycosyltransferase involved in cell wall biosynthesis